MRRRRGGGSAPRPSRAGPRRAPPLFTPAGSGPPLPLRARRSACSLKAPAHYSARASAPAGRRTCVFFLYSNTHYRACAAPGHLARRCLASALAPPGPRLFGAPRRCAPAPLACARSFLPPGGERRKSIFAARARAWSGLAPLLAPAFCPARTSGPPPNLRLSLRTRVCGALARPAARERKRCGARKGRAACFLGGLSPFRG